ncbi:MAG: integration host factor subunit beta [SAR324 cluster bacterium]|jgi:integration host factor subunit beta|uniref:Integration host factor subunit beta n=1 Tax=SAR324 cluster bacterium TaxID=2024889 RepID=A0A432GTW8_9DELT|nr:MAG: integration host factor subunit beta [SAR324 cluster bacterium]RTZ88416.1 MAG: integration host factor subunit beta [SAR324 cluster bacterium]
MNKSELIEELAAKTGYNPKLTDKMVRIFFDRIKAALSAGDKVEIRGFGSFTLKKYKGYIGRNPKTGETVEVKPKQLPVFRTSKDLRSRVNQ